MGLLGGWESDGRVRERISISTKTCLTIAKNWRRFGKSVGMLTGTDSAPWRLARTLCAILIAQSLSVPRIAAARLPTAVGWSGAGRPAYVGMASRSAADAVVQHYARGRIALCGAGWAQPRLELHGSLMKNECTWISVSSVFDRWPLRFTGRTLSRSSAYVTMEPNGNSTATRQPWNYIATKGV
jgi:hypothetical protein